MALRASSILWLILILLLTSCGTSLDHPNLFSRDSNDKDQTKLTYDIIETSYSNKDITINYPQLINLSDSNKQNNINQILKEEALKVFNLFSTDDNDISLEVNFEIMWKGENVLSVRYLGLEYSRNRSYPVNVFYTTNIDLPNETKVRLTDLVNINEDLIVKFNNGKYTPFDSGLDLEQEGVLYDLLNSFSDHDLLMYFNQADEPGEENPSYSFSYLTEDSLGISLGIPHVLGDHVEFEINFKDLQSNIKLEYEVWNDFYKKFSSF